MSKVLKAPFPYFGGKSTVAQEVWKRFGKVNNYVEPFFGSGALLLANPNRGITETVNDKDHFLANFWRAVKHDPEAVAYYADKPVSEVDLNVNHYWLITEGAYLIRNIEVDRHLFDAEVAGLWLWGACSWIAKGWCAGNGSWIIKNGEWVKSAGEGIKRQLPHLGDRGKGINRRLSKQSTRRDFIQQWMTALAERMRDVRITCGDWSRIVGFSATLKRGKTAVFLDPPYSEDAVRDKSVYKEESSTVAHDCKEWAIEQGETPNMLIALCGYEHEHTFPDNWVKYRWSTRGGYSNQNRKGNDNRYKECIWFSPNCKNTQSGFF